METLEGALLSQWVGNCVVLGLSSPQDCSDMFLPLPVVCGLWCISVTCPSVIYLCPLLLLSANVMYFQVLPMVSHSIKDSLKRQLRECVEMKIHPKVGRGCGLGEGCLQCIPVQ
ncbi:hypothetical protein CHARACLAT_017829 [Characodon lateralis]|uniref:Uncharacterized protein n=1 Tax=Characodon lateralis TaxID=208331 RepID=A0ABU7DS16_9TELE|nr:hypothetical protein [Characodon lateralis]